MCSRFFLVVILVILNYLNCDLLARKTIGVDNLQGLLALEGKDNIQISINRSIDLGGQIIKLPKNSVIKIKRGQLKNGTIVLYMDRLKCKKGAFEDVTIQGTITNDIFLSSWLKLTGDYSDLYTDAIRLACNSGADFVFSRGVYRFRCPIYLYNKTSLYGKGKVTLKSEVESVDGREMCFIVAGNDDLNINGHVKGLDWEGDIHDIKIVVDEKQEGRLDSVIGLYKASNCSVYNCTIDASRIRILVTHFIGGYNNSRFANPSGGHNIRIYGNTIICQGSTEKEYNKEGRLLSCESIGFGDRNNIYIYNNYVVNASDDLGIHSCNDVFIHNNTLESLNGRIYISGAQKCRVESNTIKYVSLSQSGMGIKVTVEHSFQRPNKDITISNNIIDYTSASMDANYGIWVQGQFVLIDNNYLISNGGSNARIWLDVIDIEENQDKRIKNKGKLVPDNIVVRNNKAKSLYVVADSKYEVERWVIENNTIETDWFQCNRKEAILKDNVIAPNSKRKE